MLSASSTLKLPRMKTDRTRLHATLRIAGAATLVSFALAGCSMMSKSHTTTFTGLMSGASEVPANDSKGTGMAEASLNQDNYMLKWRVSYSNLSGPAKAGHIHGPAAAGANAPVVFPFADPASVIEGSATLTPAQAADMLAGKYYVNIHTAKFPNGEIRAQLVPKS